MSEDAASSSPEETYLGDGVYASFDGFQIWTRAEHEASTQHRIAFEPATFLAMAQYAARVWRRSGDTSRSPIETLKPDFRAALSAAVSAMFDSLSALERGDVASAKKILGAAHTLVGGMMIDTE